MYEGPLIGHCSLKSSYITLLIYNVDKIKTINRLPLERYD